MNTQSLSPFSPNSSESPQQAQNYRSNPGLSQGELKLLQYDPKKYFSKEKEIRNTSYFALGTLVDNLMTSQVPIEETFVIIENHMIPKLGLLNISNVFIETGLDITPDNIEVVRQSLNYNPGWGAAAVKKWFDLECEPYINIVRANSGKIVCSSSQYDLAIKIKESFESNVYTNRYTQLDADIERIYQLEIYFDVEVKNILTEKLEMITCKSMIDIVEINHRTKTIRPIDIKTTHKQTRNFVESMRSYRYDIQAASYSRALLSLLTGKATTNTIINAHNYTVLPFLFLVETTEEKNIGRPLVYEMTKEDMMCGYYGLNSTLKILPITSQNGAMVQIPSIPGWITLLEQYVWHKTTGITDYTPQEYYQLQQNGALPTNIWS